MEDIRNVIFLSGIQKKKKHQSRRRKVRRSEISFILFVLIQKRVSLLSVYKPGQGEIDSAALSLSPKNRKQYVKTWESGIFCQSWGMLQEVL